MAEPCCHKCKRPASEIGPDALRPYGPNGEDICFACATATPADHAAARTKLHERLARENAKAGPDGILIFAEGGPRGVKKGGDA